MTSRRPRGRGERAGLSRDAIVAAGLTAARTTAPGAFSVRLLATRLGVDAMAIHYWFRGRDALLDAMAEQVLASVPAPAADGTWESRLRAVAGTLFALVSTHPGIGWPERRLDAADGTAATVQAVQAALSESGLPTRDAATAARALLDLAFGQPPGAPDEARFRAGVALVIDGLRLRALERRAAAGER